MFFDDTPGKESVTLHSENTLTTHIKHDLNLTTQGGEVHTINQTGELHIDQGSANITAHELQIHAGGTTVVLDGEGIWVKTGGETTIGDASATTNDTATKEAQAALAGSQSDQQNSKTDATKNSSDNSSAAQTDQPNMYPKVTLEFESNTLALNEYIDGPYHIQTTATVSGELDMVNTHSVNPMVVDKEGLKAQAKAAANQLFAELKVGKIDGDFPKDVNITLGLENSLISISLLPDLTFNYGIRLIGQVHKDLQNLMKGAWKISGSVTFTIIMTAVKNNSHGHASSKSFQEAWEDISSYLQRDTLQLFDSIKGQVFKLAAKLEAGFIETENGIIVFGEEMGNAEIQAGEDIISNSRVVYEYIEFITMQAASDGLAP